jgi:sec-independent protein translocase protein TatA
LLIILVIVVLVFGASKLADLGGALGKGIREFKKETSSIDQDKAQLSAPAAPAAAPPQAPAAAAAPVLVCSNCRAELPANAQFCQNCGARVNAPATPTA